MKVLLIGPDGNAEHSVEPGAANLEGPFSTAARATTGVGRGGQLDVRTCSRLS